MLYNSVVSENHGKTNGGPNQWVRVKITLRLSWIHPSVAEFPTGDVKTNGLG